MATLAPFSTPTRRPFGLVTDNKLRQLQSIKNRQNALAPSSAPSLKRRAPSPDISDSENVDPNLLDTIGKRKRAAFDSDVSCSKPSRYSLDVVSKPRPAQATATPRLDTWMKTSTTPLSAPPAAGRSPPKPNRHGVLPPKRKLVPPSLGIKGPGISISAALNGTLAGKKRAKARTLENSKPKSWFFDIYEEPEKVQNDRMEEWTLSTSASFLDVSDDESKEKEQTDRGKENIDPNQVSAPVTRAMAAAAAKAAADELKKDLMTDDRDPLSDLNPVDYYAPGLDATSVVLVQDDVAQAKETTTAEAQDVSAGPDSKASAEFTFVAAPEVAPVSEDILATEDIGAIIAASAPTWDSPADEAGPASLPVECSADIEIWESQSAKDEDEKAEGSVDDSVFALQEV
ncbi:hypothetical protein DV738_g3235, partial [Chaetothyriales sp. CBS 135597]